MDVYLESPYLDDPNSLWLKGNLHAHSQRSDGGLEPQEVIDAYAAAGYDFFMFSDHDVFGSTDGLDGKGMVLLTGNEVSAGGPHLLHVGAACRVEPDPDRQKVIDAINADGGLAILCHPNWQEHFNHYPYEKLLELRGYAGIEIFNGTVVSSPGEARATDKWDRLLSEGRFVWGYAADDSHGAHGVGLAWTVVRARDRSAEAVLEALRKGSCYASSGVEIETIRCEGPQLYVKAPNAGAIAVFGEHGKRFEFTVGNELRLDVSPLLTPYVRVECYGCAGQMAWTQPLLIRGGKIEQMRRLAEDKPVLHALRVRQEPRLTGRMDDPTWQQAEATSRFLVMKVADPAEVETTVRCLVSQDHLYFGIRCAEPHMDGLKTNIHQHGNPSLWTDDSIELFIDPGATAARYLHVMVNAEGYTYTTWMPTGEAGPGIKALTSRDDTGWTAEIAIPAAALAVEAGPPDKYGLHLCRNRRTVGATYVWAWVGSSNHSPNRFGQLVLD